MEMIKNPPARRRTRRTALLLSAMAVIGMGSVTVACSPRNDKPAETSVTTTPSASTTPAAPSETEKNVRTNVTRTPAAAVPGGGNPAVPCGFGPAGGGPCSNNNNN
ncbi:MAG: hypothetical protein ACR2JM_17130 [Mycobacterium sp.]